jgi:uncharacterized protein (DUF1697 family)
LGKKSFPSTTHRVKEMKTCIALIRGINVGRAKRVAMKDLRDLVESHGHENVRTVLNSGNVIFSARDRKEGDIAHFIENGIGERFGFSAAVVVISARDLAAIIREDPFGTDATDPGRYLVAFVSRPGTLELAEPLLHEPWSPDAIAIGAKAAYLWCPKGVSDSKLVQAFSRLLADSATSRNWATVLKLHAAASVSHAAEPAP